MPDLPDRLALWAEWCAAFSGDGYMCNTVVWRESIGDWDKNWRCVVYGPCWSPTGDCGLGQLNAIHAARFAAHGWDMSVDCFDPAKNIVIAQELYAASGDCPWRC